MKTHCDHCEGKLPEVKYMVTVTRHGTFCSHNCSAKADLKTKAPTDVKKKGDWTGWSHIFGSGNC